MKLPSFPTASLPGVIRHWSEAESEATQTPPDLAALLSLSVCGACLAKRVSISPRSGWIEPLNIFTAILLEPGNRKSAVFSDATRPLREIESEMIEQARPEIARMASRRRQLESRLKKVEKKIVDSINDDPEIRREADDLAEQLDREPVPTLPGLIADDSTDEKLAMMMADNGGRIASMSAEGGVFDVMAGKYSAKGEAFLTHLKGHAGDDLVVDRVGRDSIRVPQPALTCAYAIQPVVIKGVASNAAFRGRGLLGRFLYSAPPSKIGQRTISPNPVPEKLHGYYADTVRALSRLSGEHVLHLDRDAQAAFLDWEGEVEGMLAYGGPLEYIRDWGGKLAGATLRLAGIMHCVETDPDVEVEASTIGAAITISRYLIPHAHFVLSEMTNESEEDDLQKKLLQWIISKGGEVTVREVSRGLKEFKGKVGDSEHALNELVEEGFGSWEYIHTATNLRRVFRLKTSVPESHSRNTADSSEYGTGTEYSDRKNSFADELGRCGMSISSPDLSIPVRLHHIPNWLRLRCLRAFGTNYGLTDGWSVLQHAVSQVIAQVKQEYPDHFDPPWLDHWGSIKTPEGVFFVTEPYCEYPPDFPRLLAPHLLAYNVDARLIFTPEGRWHPSTIRLIFKPNEVEQ